jgi:hypothetical protein
MEMMNKADWKKVLIASAISVFIGAVVLIVLVMKKKRSKLSIDKLQDIVKNDLETWNGLKETDRKGAEILREWWGYFGYDYSVEELMSSTFQSNHYWSAIYISSLMKRWGLGNRFKYSARHAKFLMDGKNALLNKDDSKAFWTYAPTDAKLEVGDILAKPRTSGLSYDNLHDRAKTHTDVVYAIKKTDEGYDAYLVGGNLSNTVKAFVLRLDKDQKLINPENYLGIMKNRLV